MKTGQKELKKAAGFKKGDRVRINIGSSSIPSLLNSFGTIVCPDKGDTFIVNIDGYGELVIHTDRLSLIQ